MAGKQAYSFLDGYSGYNQISIAEEDQPKIAFITEYGVFAFKRMPFGLTNAPATFQRLMNHAFREYLRQFLEVFLDNLCVHSSWKEHLSCLQKVFERCRYYRISLNPHKCQFWVKHGVILGHIVSRNGISTDEGKVKLILELPPPINYKGVQRFMGHVGYYRRFILFFAEIARPLYKLLIEFKWSDKCQESYDKLKKALASAPILKQPNWDIIFHVHIDASNFAIGCVLAQPGDHKLDYPISFASRQLCDAEINYTTTEREGLAMVYAVKKFCHYLLANQFVFYVDHQALLYLVNKPCATGRITRWMLILLEFDFTVVVRPGKKHLMADHMSRIPNGEPPIGIDDDLADATLFLVDSIPQWSEHIIDVLTNGLTNVRQLGRQKAWQIVKECADYQLIAGQLYKRGKDDILRRCPREDETLHIMEEAHQGVGGGHFAAEITARKIMLTGYWWPTLFKDCTLFVRGCDECQRCSKPGKQDFMPLHPMAVNKPFEKWGLDFFGPISPAARGSQARYIITTTDYVTK